MCTINVRVGDKLKILSSKTNKDGRTTKMTLLVSEREAREIIHFVRGRIPKDLIPDKLHWTKRLRNFFLRAGYWETQSELEQIATEEYYFLSIDEFVEVTDSDTIQEEIYCYGESSIRRTEKGWIYTTISNRTLEYNEIENTIFCNFGENGSIDFASSIVNKDLSPSESEALNLER